ncbi:MAG: AmmeMemoRadiSam system protein B [Acidobacteria bacterium]|nr:AmmeMemoRadiSam system protein B [Acidobacteriota bacterium]
MAQPLPKLRADLEFLPSPAPDQPGLLIRDPLRYTHAMLVIPPPLVSALCFLDGENTDLDLQTDLCRRTGQLVSSDVVTSFVQSLSQNGFLETEEFFRLRESCQEEFRQAPRREAVHAGAAYPAQPSALRQQFDEYFRQAAAPSEDSPELLGIAAPHVSPIGGWRCYASAYQRLNSHLAGKTVVILGTSHFGQPERFGLTRKPFATPLGTVEVDTALADWLVARGGEAVVLEDYCHSIEHSIEFQCAYLRYALDTPFRILPILCGPFLKSLLEGHAPESDPAVNRFFQALGELAAQEGSRLFWVLGVDLAHVGRRYGDGFEARAEQGRMASVRRQDQQRLQRLCEGNSQGFFELIQSDQDVLRWCGYSPLYTFLKAVPQARGNILNYEQWNIDEQSVVSFAALAFFPAEAQSSDH